MKTRFLLFLIPSLLLAVLVGFWLGRAGAPSDAKEKVAEETKSMPGAISAEQRKRDLAHLIRVPEDMYEPFWISAVVPDPAQPRLPSSVAIQGTPSAPDAALKTAERVLQLEASERTVENQRQLNSETILWFDQDPQAATAWLNATPAFDHLGFALASIAASLNERGQTDAAHIVIENISDPDVRRSALLDIYSLQARYNLVTRETLEAAGWSPSDIDLVFQGD
jgi:hypothetical protein